MLQSLAFTLKTDPKVIKQLDKFRQKRNISDYDQPGLVTEQEVEEMITLAQQIRDNVEEWIRTNHVGLAKEL